MNKGEFLDAIAEKAGVEKKNTSAVFEAMTEVISETLKSGDKIILAGFGTFETRNRAARTGRNPHTGEEIKIAAKTVPAFKPSGKLKDSVQ